MKTIKLRLMTAIDFKGEVLDKSFEQPVVVQFWAAWCGSCQLLSPVLQQLILEQRNACLLVKVDIEVAPELVAAYQIKSIPTVQIFHQGKMIADMVGAYPRHVVARWLLAFLPEKAADELENSPSNPKNEPQTQFHSEVFHEI